LEKYDGDLFDVQDTALRSEDQVVYTVYRVLVTLCHLQYMNLSHRDIKPENILASKNGKRLALCDFGLARYYSNGYYPEHTTPSVQTACYRAPEIMFRDLDSWSRINFKNMDIWSLGITALKLLELDFLCPTEDQPTMDLQKLYMKIYGPDGLFESFIEDKKSKNGPFLTKFLWLINDMLTLDPALRPDAEALLRHGIFDCYRSGSDSLSRSHLADFEQARAFNLLKVLPETEISKQVRQHLYNIANYPFNNVESARLAVCMIYLLPKDDREDVDIMTVIALAAAVFDTDTIDMDVSASISMLSKLDYDLMLPVMDKDVVQRLGRLMRPERPERPARLSSTL
jgi:serine/threonine protein kinase